MSLMEREYMREDYKKEISCKRWNGKEGRKREYYDSINFDSLYINKESKYISHKQSEKINIDSQKNIPKKNNSIRTFIIFFIIGFMLFLAINFCANNTIIF